MLGKQLKRLATVANIATLEMAAPAMTLQTTEAGVLAWFAGIYSAGGVIVESGEQIPSLPIQPEQFKAIAALFDDVADVRFSPRATELELKAGRQRQTLKYLPKPISTTQETFGPVAATLPAVRVKTAELLAELSFLKGVATKNSAAPILSGVRMIAINERMGLQGANGTTLVYQSAIPAQANERFEVVAPVEDMLVAMTLFADEATVGMALMGRALVLKGERTYAKLQTMAGVYPNVSSAFAGISFDETLNIAAPTIRALVASARAYKAPPMATFRPAEGGDGIVVETDETELGQFQEIIDGTFSTARLYGLSVDDLDVASRLTDGDLGIALSSEKSMALVQSEGHRLYISTRVV